MSHFPVHTRDTSPEGSLQSLDQTHKGYGFVPNLYGVFASSPAAIKGYIAINEAFQKDSGFSPAEQQVVLLAVSVANQCEYCVAAHSTVAAMAKVPEEIVNAIREGQAVPDSKLEALRRFTEKVIESRGRPTREELDAFFAAGYEGSHVLGVLVGVAQKTLSNYVNHIAETPLDPQFEPKAWTSSRTVGA
jgi:uncharacterized peroxidase-related enzyme